MPTTYELYNYSVAKHGVYNATTIELRKKLESEIVLANEDAKSLANMLSYDAHPPEKLDDGRTSKELVEAALAPDKISTDAERVELFETFAEETLPKKNVGRATKQYKEDISGADSSDTPTIIETLLRLPVDETKEEKDRRRRAETLVLTVVPGAAVAARGFEQFRKEGIFAPAPVGELEKEREGMLDKILGILLIGERASGTTIYELRKRLGFGGIDWIEQKEAGEIFKEISPSQALGISTPETKLLSSRGAVSLAIDIVLDPLTYVGVGVIGKAGKGIKALKIGEKTKEAEKMVGQLGIEYIQETVARGISRETAERKLVQSIERGQVEYLAAKKYAEPSVHIFGQKLFYTRPYQQLMKQMWDILPYAEKRAKGVDVVKTAFIPFHKIIKDVGAEAKKPFQQFYRRTAAETAILGKSIERLFGKTPKTASEEIVLALEKGVEPTSPQAKEAAVKLRKIYDEAFEEQVSLGMIKPEQYRELYMHHALTKEGREWMKKELGSEYERELDIAEYRKRLGSKEKRLIEGDVYEVNKMMQEKHGIKEFFVEDPYLATQAFGVQHVKATRSHILHQQVMEEYGRSIEIIAKQKGVQPRVAKIDGIEHSLFKFKGEETYLPTAIVDELKRTRPATGFWSEVYDPSLGTLKKAWISIWPGFYARNIYGGVGWQNILAGVEPSDYARNIDVLYGDPTRVHDIPLYGKLTGKELKELMEEYNVYGQTGFVGEPSSYITGVGALGRAYKKYPEQAMHLTENQLRGSVFLHYFYKTGDPEFASEMVYKYHFEYLRGAYTPFEEDVLLRTVPFGKWLLGNIPLQAEMVVRQPGKYAALAKAREMATTPEEFNLLTDWQKQKIMYAYEDTAIAVDLPIFELPGLYGREEAYFGLTPFLKFGMQMLEGRDEYGRKMAPLTTREGVKEHAAMTAMTFAGRYVYALREFEKTAKGERPLEYTIAHQLAGVGIYDLKESYEKTEEAFEAAKYTTPSPTTREMAVAWAAQGRVKGAKVFALPLPEDEDERRWRAVGTMPIEVNEQTVKRVIEKLEGGDAGLYRLRGFGTLVSLTAEEREMTKGFKPTDEQLKLLEEISEIGITEEGATARDLYLEMFREKYEEYTSRLYQREAFTDEERMAAVARRSSDLTDLRFKEIRYETGEKAGILALTPEEYEEYSGMALSEAEKAWMFREGKPLPEEGYKRYQEDIDEMYAALITERYERLRYTPFPELEKIIELPMVKMAPSDQLRVWKEEREAQRLQEEEWREELSELREDPIGVSISQKGIPAALMITRGGQAMQTRFNRSEELENLLGTGVDR